jgi:Bacteriophage protein GP30.3
MNIGSGNLYPANALSNFSPHPFVFDGILCNSMEGFLQSLKFDKIPIQQEVCKLVGRAAKFRGKKRNKAWQSKQCLWWNGISYRRDGQEYWELLWDAYLAIYNQSDSFRRALKASGSCIFSHSLGTNDESKTVLTEREFCRILHNLRDLGEVLIENYSKKFWE